MKSSTVISLIAGAAVLVAAGLAVIYLGGGEDPAPSGQEASSTAAPSSESQSVSATTQSQSETQPQSDASTAPAAQDSAAAPAAGQSAPAEAEQPVEDGETQTAGLAPQDGEEAAAPDAPLAPSFDVVRIGPGGAPVLAARAEPNSKATILDNGTPIGTVTADGKGEWVFVPETPLSPGSRELSLESESPGGLKIPSEEVVVMSVPERQTPPASSSETAAAGSATQGGGTEAAEQPLAVLQPRQGGGASEVLQAPKGEGIAEGDLVLESVDYGDDGEITVSGRAQPGSTVRLYLDNELVGEAMPGEDGRWSHRLAKSVPYGVYQLRADQVDDGGKVVARVETPFSRVEFARAELPDERFVIVQPGNSLWRIARGTLGAGVQYTVIYEATADQIRDPNLIYPGQIFAVPRTN